MVTAKVVEVIGHSKTSFEDAVRSALKDCCATLKNVKGVEVVGQTAKVEDGEVVSFKATCKIVYQEE